MRFRKFNLGPFSYLGSGLVVGAAMWYFDYWRRCATEELLYKEDRRRYSSKIRDLFRGFCITIHALVMVRAMNQVRVG